MGRFTSLIAAILVVLCVLTVPVRGAAPVTTATTAPAAADQLTIQALLPTGETISGLASNQLIKIGSDWVSLADVQSFGKTYFVYLRDGRRLRADFSQIEPIAIRVGPSGIKTLIELKQVKVLHVVLPSERVRPLPSVAAPAAAPVPAEEAPAAAEDAPTVVKLPAVADDIVAAGGGEKLLVLIKRLGKIAVFDVKTNRIAGYIPAPANDVAFTGGNDKVLVALNDQNVLQRWDLKTLAKEQTIPMDQPADSLVMGWASNGPAVINAKTVYDVATLKPVGVAGQTRGYWGMDRGSEVRASGDGTTLAAWRTHSSPTGMFVGRLTRYSLDWIYEHDSASPLLPTFDGSLICTSFQGFYTPNIKRIPGDAFRDLHCIPAYHPSYILGVRRFDSYDSDQRGKKGEVLIYTSSDRRLLLTLPPASEMLPARGSEHNYRRDALTIDKRFFFMPSVNKLITFPDTNDQLVVRNLDIRAEMEKRDIDYLYVDSIPNRLARPGQPYQYQIVTRSRKGGVKFKFDSGPKGMTLTKDGLLKWQVPKGLMDNQVSVIVTISDAGGQTACHAFTVDLGLGGPGGGGAGVTIGPGATGRPGGNAIVITPRGEK
jgi:hypothetical protein